MISRRKVKKKRIRKNALNGNKPEPSVNLGNLLTTYQKICKESCCPPSPKVVTDLQKYINLNKYLVRFIIYPDANVKNYMLEPLIKSIRNVHYTFIKELYLWKIPLQHSHTATLALMMEKGDYKITTLELEDCDIGAYSIARLSKSFQSNTLVNLVLDFNEFGDEGVEGLCNGLKGNSSLIKLSLNYCGLTHKSGKILSKAISSTAIREVYLDSNKLGPEGVRSLIEPFVEQSIIEVIERRQEKEKKEAEAAKLAAEEGTKRQQQLINEMKNASNPRKSITSRSALLPLAARKKKKKRKKKVIPVPPGVGAWISKLHFADNGLDLSLYNDTSAPLGIMMMLKNFIANSTYLTELNLDGNLIGDLGGLEIRDGLVMRKTARLPQLKITIGVRMQAETLTKILKLSGRLSKKRRRVKKK
ncbi:NACHT, LRR and PYD domains-containing protein 5 [Trichoplax sp. H2]|uniref:Uncharacterized protein n=1 Tax=Trichoplax adhaerens TaxID=10228 RepID=B3RM09_TRIAD|nr:hypothetical protein TRIADDRAFT_52192 [Trichoplax adhaerens]EDV28880.1 hypothetical protein TRIADDRAFT_52192 [Trichoplax adhaerens]RDD46672.1 NACHT, LRR and PYD domains-containing protein 5 [Trichoplax sp. H2]|eukprot:XP_002108082.1 hypothetical protein TRIADDRAFT_52192 [Trichoplax adhaerens]